MNWYKSIDFEASPRRRGLRKEQNVYFLYYNGISFDVNMCWQCSTMNTAPVAAQ